MVCHNIPIRPGRNLAIIVESAAVNYRQKKMGYNAAKELYNRVQRNLMKNKDQMTMMNKSSMDALYDRLRERCTDTRTKEPMKKHTTFQVGGPADYFITPGSTEELRAVLELCREEGIPFFILGNGSNLLVSDQGYRGAVIHIGKAFSEYGQKEPASRRERERCCHGWP